ncbi:MAG: hypothetical protein IPJ88_11750 [Myxococcales bacterium]|nr:MAG: hypothetical protein IPJ88_11750 [Myxococcales bacterium]
MNGQDTDRDKEHAETHAFSDDPDDEFEYERRPSSFERILPELLRKGFEKGIEAGLNTLNRTDGALRGVVGDARLPKEMANYVFAQVDDTKKAILKIVAREVRDVLHATDIVSELEKALQNLTVDLHTEIRFKKSKDGERLEPQVKSTSSTSSQKTKE